ncbi:hypothetical protein ACEPPN_012147 [Leptodophora sp. 'Broadleaf-Isolate-01']
MATSEAESSSSPNHLVISDLRFDHYARADALGVDATRPFLSWKYVQAPAEYSQEGYELTIWEILPDLSTKPMCTVAVASPESVLVPWPLEASLRSRQRIGCTVSTWGRGVRSTQSGEATLETGLLQPADWKCKRITVPWTQDSENPTPEQIYRKSFRVKTDTEIGRARLYITSHGVYEAEINGQRVGDHFLAPGWTSYNERLMYQTYDVEGQLSSGNDGMSCIGVRIGEGWYSGHLGPQSLAGRRGIWGSQNAVMVQLEITYRDGTVDTVVSDESWTCKLGPTQLAEMYRGEKYDGRLADDGWSQSRDLVGTDWQQVQVLGDMYDGRLDAQGGPPMRHISTVPVSKTIKTPSGKVVLDFGQNIVGFTRIKSVSGQAGQAISLRHFEVLESEEPGTRPLRLADQLDIYTVKGCGNETWEPRFTIHGFRYVEVDGWPAGDADVSQSIEAVVVASDLSWTGTFGSSNHLLNKLHENVCWSLRGNFTAIPTDCPQRDERLGWTGDIALFGPTGLYLTDCFSMLKRWLVDVAIDQRELQGVPAWVTPNVLRKSTFNGGLPTAIWDDTLYQSTGDVTVLSVQYDSMLDWLRVLPRDTANGSRLWNPACGQWGDWLDPDAPSDSPWQAKTAPDLVANAFLVHCLKIMSKISLILGDDARGRSFDEEYESCRVDFIRMFITPTGRLVSESQTGYTLCIFLNLFETAQQLSLAGQRLAQLVIDNHCRISTGFAGTPYLCEALSLTGYGSIAVRTLLNEENPSWLYQVKMGATTVWERWDSMLSDGTINPGEMTSFNHYALGSVATYLHERVAGLRSIEVGWKRARFEPECAFWNVLDHASTSHSGPYGKIECGWKIHVGENGTRTLKATVTVPPLTLLEVKLPGVETEVVGPKQVDFQIDMSQIKVTGKKEPELSFWPRIKMTMTS